MTGPKLKPVYRDHARTSPPRETDKLTVRQEIEAGERLAQRRVELLRERQAMQRRLDEFMRASKAQAGELFGALGALDDELALLRRNTPMSWGPTVTLRRYKALKNCVLTDSFGREHRLQAGRGGDFDGGGNAQELVRLGFLEEVNR
jgi:hypothetical protein